MVARAQRATLCELLTAALERHPDAPDKVPAFVSVVEEFPVTTGTNGTKIRTAELRRRAAEQLAAAETRGAR